MVNFSSTKIYQRVLVYSVLALSLSIFAMNSALAGGLNAIPSTSKLALDDSFTLKLSNDSGDRTPPDLSPLQKDFQILGSSQSSQTTIINGARTDSFAWMITLSPRATGEITIPAIKAGSLSSDPVVIEVLDAASMPADRSGTAGLSIDVELEPGTHYVHEEIPLTVTITAGEDARELQLSEPSSSDFSLKQSGDDRIYQSVKNGTRVNVLERKYILQSQKSGSLTVPSLVLRARVDDPNARRRAFGGGAFDDLFGGRGMSSPFFDDFFNRGKQVAVSSKPLAIDIESRPGGGDSWFLPARDVRLQESWEPAKPVFRVGEGVTRRVQLLALGASQEQLPDLQLTAADGARVYVDRSNDDTVDTDKGTVAMREFITSVVPTGAGEITLPAIEVKWWDTEADVERIASLPAETYAVQGGSSVTDTPAVSQPVNARPKIDTDLPLVDKTGTASANPPRMWLTIVAIALLALLALGWRLRSLSGAPGHSTGSRPEGSSVRLSPAAQNDSTGRALQAVKSACKNNDRAAAYAACIAWLNLVFGERSKRLSNLREISPRLADELAGMEQAIYAQGYDSPWNGDSLLKCINAANRDAANKKSSRNNRVLPPLYPPVIQT